MHKTQLKLLELANTANLAKLKLREIGALIGEPHPQKVKHHLNQLFKKGFLSTNKEKTFITRVNKTPSPKDLFVSLPILGNANCGEALAYADEQLDGYLQVSKSLVPNYQPNKFFVVKAIGNSMNRAEIGVNRRPLEDGDFAIINKDSKNKINGKYVLSIINGMANIKKLVMDEASEQIALVSESTVEYNPIYIHRNDLESFLINGEVVQVIKRAN